MKKRKLSLFGVLGFLLILAGISLFLVFHIRTEMGIRHCHRIISQMLQLLPERSAGIPGISASSAMPVLEIENIDYVGMLEIPSIGLSLPVADQWDKADLYRSPSRFFGSAYDNSLVIGGIDHAEQFAFCKKIEHGALLTVTDMTGVQFTYEVARIDRAKHADPAWLMHTDFALTLFCHDIYSMEYIAVRCHAAFS
ncbi:MAG: sortase [Clostridiales bacterium]|nr:sortase [Clostridiales bacterium]